MDELQQLKKDIDELAAMKELIQSENFQKYFARPMKEKRDELRTAFFSDSLKSSWRKGGKQEGINEFLELVKQIPIDLKNKIHEAEQIESSQRGE